MTPEKLMDAIGGLPGDLIAQTDALRCAPRKKPLPVRRWAALAACLVLVMGLGFACLRTGLLSGMGGSAKQAAPEAPMEAAPTMAPAASNEITAESAADSAPRAEATEEEAPVMDSHPLTLTLRWGEECLTAEAGNFTVTEVLADGSVSETLACGAHPLQQNPEPVAVSRDAVTLEWAVPPDRITARCWPAGADAEAEGFSLSIPGSTLPVLAEYQVYEITAVWNDTCTASYAVYLDLQTE